MLAAALSAAVFLGLFFGAQLVWWLALALAVAVYGAVLLIVRRRRRADEIVLGARVTQADVQAAGEALRDSAERLDKAAAQVPEADREAVEEMARHVWSIRENVLEDADDYRLTRRFIGSYLPNIVKSVETYAQLASKAARSQPERLAAVGKQIREYGPVLEHIDQACIENDFAALESEVDALGAQLSRRIR